MPKSSRHKSSHRQSKQGLRDGRDCSGSEEDVKVKSKNGKEEMSAKVCKDSSYSGEKRKVSSHSRESKGYSGNALEENVVSRRRKDRADASESVRGNERGDIIVVEKEGLVEGSLHGLEKNSKLKVSSDSRNRTSRRKENGSERNEEDVVVKGEYKNGKVELKSKDAKAKNKDSVPGDVSQYKVSREKEHGSERNGKVDVSKRDVETPVSNREVKKKQESQLLDSDGRLVKGGIENTEALRGAQNPELQKELEKRVRKRRDGSVGKDRYKDVNKDCDGGRLSSRSEHAKDETYKEEEHEDSTVKCRDNVDRDSRHRDSKQRDEFDKDRRHREEKHRDERVSRDHPGDKSETKYMKDESNSSESWYRKSRTRKSYHDDSHDDRSAGYKDDNGKRKYDGKDDQSDIRSRSAKEKRSDAEKKSRDSEKLEMVSERGGSRSFHGDVEIANQNGRWSSPRSSSHVSKDQNRYLKQAESRYRDTTTQENAHRNSLSSKEITGVSGVPEKDSVVRHMDKLIHEDSHSGELSERCPNSDGRTSPKQLVNNSPSMIIDRKHLTRAGVRRRYDLEEFGQSSVGKDEKDLYSNEGKGSREFFRTSSADEGLQADRDEYSTSSPFSRTSHSNSNSRFLPPFPFRPGVDSPSNFCSEEDNRGKLNNRFKRTGNSNVGRAQSNAWKGVPTWPSPVTNSFLPFQNGPPPVGFHPMMHPFSVPPMFGLRPAMEYNHSGAPYHISDAERFSSQGRCFGWQSPADDSFPPLSGWDVNSGVIGSESHIYGRLNWDHNRTIISGREWEASLDTLEVQSTVAMELPSLSPKDISVSAGDIIADVQTSQQVARNEQNENDVLVENIDINQSGDALVKKVSETSKILAEKKPDLFKKITRDDDATVWHVYLSKLDISEALTHPELYNQCRSLVGTREIKRSDKDASQMRCLEGVLEARVKILSNSSNASLVAAINDSVFQRAMSLYKKQREEMNASYLPFVANRGKTPFCNAENLEFASNSDKEKAAPPDPISDENKSGEKAEGMSTINEEKEKITVSLQDVEVPNAIPSPKTNELFQANYLVESEIPNPNLDTVKMEVDQDISNCVIVGASQSAITDAPSGDNPSARSTGEQGLVNLIFSDMASKSKMVSDSNECESISLSRIHHSPESTH